METKTYYVQPTTNRIHKTRTACVGRGTTRYFNIATPLTEELARKLPRCSRCFPAPKVLIPAPGLIQDGETVTRIDKIQGIDGIERSLVFVEKLGEDPGAGDPRENATHYISYGKTYRTLIHTLRKSHGLRTCAGIVTDNYRYRFVRTQAEIDRRASLA